MTLTSTPNQIGDSGLQTQNEMSGADALMDSLRRHGVDTIFGYPGGQSSQFMMRFLKQRKRGG